MQEKEFMQQLIRERAVNDTKVMKGACAAVPHKAVIWKRAAAIAAIGVTVLIATVLLIPSARAEVLGWFGMSSAEDYLTTDAQDRPSIPELDALIVTPAPETQEQTAEASAAVLQTEIDKHDSDWLWQEIAEHFSAHIGETMFDGGRIYVMIDFDGLSGYPVFENENGWFGEIDGGAPRLSLLSERIAPENVRCFYDDNANLKRYLSGEKELWFGPDSILDLTLRKGDKTGRMSGDIVMVPRAIDLEFQQELVREYGINNRFSHEAASDIMQRVLEHFRKNGLKAYAYFNLDNGTATKLLDGSGESVFSFIDFETGIMQATASFRVLLDHGMERETMLNSEIGPVSINMRAYQGLTVRTLSPVTESVSFSGIHTFGCYLQSDFTGYRIENREAPLDGVTLSVENPGSLNLLGLDNICLRAVLPEDWSEELKDVFLHSLSFTIEAEDSRFYAGFTSYPNEDGSYSLYLRKISGIPFVQFSTIRSVRVIPALNVCGEVSIFENVDPGEVSDTPIEVIPLGPNDEFRSETLSEGVHAEWEEETVLFPEWAITLDVQ